MYQVIVGNIGRVYSGGDEIVALERYNEYVEQSKCGYGRAAKERVVLLDEDDIWFEYDPDEQEEISEEQKFKIDHLDKDISMTISELSSRFSREGFNIVGLNPYCLNEGLASKSDTILINWDKAKKLGIQQEEFHDRAK